MKNNRKLLRWPYGPFLMPLLVVVLLFYSACDKEVVLLSRVKKIEGFSFLEKDNGTLGLDVPGGIDEDGKSVVLTVPYGTDVSQLTPVLEVSEGASFFPEGPQDFTKSVPYTVTAEDGSEISYEVTVEFAANTEKQIVEFMFPEGQVDGVTGPVVAEIDEETKIISMKLPHGTDLGGLTPNIKVSDKADYVPKGAQDFSKTLVYTVTAEDGSDTKYEVRVEFGESGQKQILELVFGADINESLTEDVIAEIDQETKAITTKLPLGTDLAVLTPRIKVSDKADFVPKGAQDFSKTVVYTVTAEDGSDTKYEVRVEVGESGQKQILDLVFGADINESLTEDVIAEIDEELKTLNVTVPFGTEVEGLVPTLGLSDGATFAPQGAQDFSQPVEYTITAEDGSQVTYQVLVQVAPNTEKQILNFILRKDNNPDLSEDITAVVDEQSKTISFKVPYSVNLTALLPTLEVSVNASYTPEGPQDFNNVVVYRVTAEDGSTVDYQVKAEFEAFVDKKVLVAIYEANPGSNLDWDLNSEDISGYSGVILDGKSNRVIVLDLKDMNLVVIPKEIGELSELQRLELQSNGIGQLPEELGNLTQLETLLLDHNALVGFPEEILDLEALRRLSLGGNAIGSVPNTIARLQNLGTLRLSNCGLSGIPLGLAQLTKLGILYLGENPLSNAVLFDDLKNLTKLNLLNLRNTGLTVFPNFIKDLGNLVHLNMQNNNILEIPENAIGNKSALRTLLLSHNRLENLPEDFTDYENLEELYLDANQLTSIPETIGNLTNLRYLDIQGNSLGEVPAALGELLNLSELYLSGNSLEEVPAALGELLNLSELELNGNRLKSVPKELANLLNLRVLKLNENELTNVPVELGELCGLGRLYLDDNPLDCVPVEILQLRNCAPAIELLLPANTPVCD